jgi:hypothetical protein
MYGSRGHDSSLGDWLRLRPVLKQYKLARRRALGRIYARRAPPEPAQVARVMAALGRQQLAVTIAYNTPWVIDWHLRFSRRYLPDTDLLVADNSADPAAARAIEMLCGTHGVAYIRLPPNRFSLTRPRDVSLSHAAALNWVLRHVIAPAQPPVFAFLDHDLIALRRVELGQLVASQPFYGRRLDGRDGAWCLWPGYAIFASAAARPLALDFWPSYRFTLDTGGGNWQRFFRHFDGRDLAFARMWYGDYQYFDDWVHLGSASAYRPQAADWRPEAEAWLAARWAEGEPAAVATARAG